MSSLFLSRFGELMKIDYNTAMKIITGSVAETRKIGLKLAQKTTSGHLFALIGDLGGGKTELTKGLARGFGIKKLVASPTFILMNVHQIRRGRLRHFCHVDLYRLKKQGDITDVGLKEFLGQPDTVVVIEWADKISRLLAPYKKTTIHFSFINSHCRAISITKNRRRRS